MIQEDIMSKRKNTYNTKHSNIEAVDLRLKAAELAGAIPAWPSFLLPP